MKVKLTLAVVGQEGEKEPSETYAKLVSISGDLLVKELEAFITAPDSIVQELVDKRESRLEAIKTAIELKQMMDVLRNKVEEPEAEEEKVEEPEVEEVEKHRTLDDALDDLFSVLKKFKGKQDDKKDG